VCRSHILGSPLKKPWFSLPSPPGPGLRQVYQAKITISTLTSFPPFLLLCFSTPVLPFCDKRLDSATHTVKILASACITIIPASRGVEGGRHENAAIEVLIRAHCLRRDGRGGLFSSCFQISASVLRSPSLIRRGICDSGEGTPPRREGGHGREFLFTGRKPTELPWRVQRRIQECMRPGYRTHLDKHVISQ
jgi:hypothetical protein